MKRTSCILLVIFLVISTMWAVLANPNEAQALPEYSSQTGEPCATCHLSPSGGGPRGPRGQAWIGSDKPSAVPSLVESLELLGVEMDVDPKDFEARDVPVSPAQPLELGAGSAGAIHAWLRDYDGN